MIHQVTLASEGLWLKMVKAKCLCIINPFWSGPSDWRWQHWPYLLVLVLSWAHFIEAWAVDKSQLKPPLFAHGLRYGGPIIRRRQHWSDSYMLIQHRHNSLYSHKCTGMETEPTYTRRKLTGIKLFNPACLKAPLFVFVHISNVTITYFALQRIRHAQTFNCIYFHTM